MSNFRAEFGYGLYVDSFSKLKDGSDAFNDIEFNNEGYFVVDDEDIVSPCLFRINRSTHIPTHAWEWYGTNGCRIVHYCGYVHNTCQHIVLVCSQIQIQTGRHSGCRRSWMDTYNVRHWCYDLGSSSCRSVPTL